MNEIFYWNLVAANDIDSLWNAVDAELERRALCAPLGFPDGAGRWVLYGAGRFGGSVLKAWAESGIVPSYCVDSDPKKWGTFLEGVPVCRPERLSAESKDCAVMIAAMSTHEIENRLNDYNVPYLFAERDGSTGLISGHELATRRDELDRIYGRLADDQSRKVLLGVLKARMFQRYHFPMRGNVFSADVASQPQYFQNDVVRFNRDEYFIDCGTFDGDSIISFFTHARAAHPHGNFRALGIEADRINAANTRNVLEKYGLTETSIVNAGLGCPDNQVVPMDFHSCREEEGSKNNEVPMASLDTLLAGQTPTFIKMDIEGAELDALIGAKDTLSRAKPKLAICIYHQTSDLIDIPAFLLRLDGGKGKVYLRHHNPGSLWETVCYWVNS